MTPSDHSPRADRLIEEALEKALTRLNHARMNMEGGYDAESPRDSLRTLLREVVGGVRRVTPDAAPGMLNRDEAVAWSCGFNACHARLSALLAGEGER